MKRITLMGVLSLAVGALAVSSAQASTVTVGSPLTAPFSATPNGSVGTVTDNALPEAGANVNSPVTGTIVRWRILDASGGPFKLRVLTPNGGTTYTGAGTSAPETPATMGLQTFSTNLPIKAGQTIAFDNTASTDKTGAASVPSASILFWSPTLADGSMAPATGSASTELAFNADVQPNQPSISSISPTSGSVTGGTSVTVRGKGFTGATGVRLGSLPAASFTVNSDSQITAVSPRSSKLGAVDLGVSVFGIDSASVPADKFTYLGCLVPKLKGKKLRRARKALKQGSCRLGKVKGPRSGRVKKQRPKRGTVLPVGSKVTVKLG